MNLQDCWYKNNLSYKVLMSPLWPVSKLFQILVWIRTYLFRIKLFKQYRFKVPVIVVGNITVGGTGKTPLVMYIANMLQQAGFKPGIVSRGYKGRLSNQVLAVDTFLTPQDVGDEPLLMAKKSICPVVIAKKRAKAVAYLLNNFEVDIVISDDGLQHYALARNIEIAVMDESRGVGNGFCLPMGPLRESKSRLRSVDIVVNNGIKNNLKDYTMRISAESTVYSLADANNLVNLDSFKGQLVHAIAGIANPNKFFNLLQESGIRLVKHAFPDHYLFTAKDVSFTDNLPIIMTEKDAVKCAGFATSKHWVLPIKVSLSNQFNEKIISMLQDRK